MLQHDLTALRTLITDQFPDLEGDGLRDALVALADRSSSLGLDVRLDLDLGLRPDVTVAGVVYRIVREGLRNVERHARATTAHVRVAATADTVTVRVADDGQGLSGDDTAVGHVGLRLLAGLLLDLGGTLELRGGPAGGTVLEARMPRELMPATLREPGSAVTTPS
jgi:signal transduction histidine kinase